MRCRFSFYQRSTTGDTYHIHPSLGLTNWTPSSSILGAVELILVKEDTIGCYKLHEDSKKRLDEIGYICRGDFRDNEPEIAPHTVEGQPENPLPDDFYEIDNILERRLSKDTFTYEYHIRFTGYSSEDDMWLPASYFNEAEVSIKARSPSALLEVIGQATKYTTVKWHWHIANKKEKLLVFRKTITALNLYIRSKGKQKATELFANDSLN